MRHYLFTIVIFLACLSPLGYPQAFAQTLSTNEVDQTQQYKIAFLPQSVPIYLHKDLTLDANIDVNLIRELWTQHTQTYTHLVPLTQDDIKKAWTQADLQQTDAEMQAEIDMGYAQDSMANMNFSAAVNILKRVTENYQKSYVQFYRPYAVAQAWQQLAYAYIAQFQENPDIALDLIHPARQAFIELIRLAPHITMLEGRQSPERVTLYNEALELFLGNPVYRHTSKNDASALAHKLDAKCLLLARIVQTKNNSLNLEIDVYQIENDHIQYYSNPIQFSDHTSHTQTIRESLIALLDQIYADLQFPSSEMPQETPTTQRDAFALEIGGVYNGYVEHPTHNALHGIGAHVSFLYMFDAHFFIRAGIEIIEMMRDRSHELYEGFEIYQFPIVAGISKKWNFIRLYGGLGLNLSFSTPHIIVQSTTCKTFGLDDIECQPEDITQNQDPFALHVAFLAGLNIGANSFYASLEGFAYVTAYPIDQTAFKHPLGIRLALQYWF